MTDFTTNEEGYLCNLHDWDETVARVIAGREGIELTADHWYVICFMRDFYQEYQMTPAMRILVKAMSTSMGPEKGNSHFLQGLFPGGLAKQACKIGGLPKPIRCI